MGSSQPSGRTFVIQCNGAVDPGRKRLCGRVEHVLSGRRERFTSEEGMIAFIARVLGEEGETKEQRGET